MTDMSRPKPSMSFEGYIERIDFHFERLGLEVGETSPITLDIGDVECPIYLISSKAFDN